MSDLDDVDLPIWPKFLAKMKSSGQSVNGDKFLYSHDVGTDCVCNVILARLPSETYVNIGYV